LTFEAAFDISLYTSTELKVEDMDIKPGIYRHYKGKDYRVIGLVRHSETLEEMVLYEALYDNDLGKLWVRPAKMFMENIVKDNYSGPRFKFIRQKL
jgi:hypothetical protein